MDNDLPIFFRKNKFYILLVAIGFFVYFNSLFSPFVWDDVSQIQNNYFIQNLNNLPRFFLGSTFGLSNSLNLTGLYYRPLMTTFFSLIFSSFGSNTFYFHFLQVSIHILNGVLIFVLFKKFFKEKLAFFLSLIFLVHPINVEAVDYISAIQEPLFFFFGILALILSLKERIRIKRAIVIGIFLLCSLLSKETGLLFIIMICAYRFIYKKPSKLITFLFTLVPLFTYLYLRFIAAKVFIQKIPDVPMMTAPITQRIFTMPEIFLYYLKTFIFPYQLLISQQWSNFQANSLFFISLFISCVILAAVVIFGIFLFHKRKNLFLPYTFFCLWFLIGIGFHMQFIPLDFTVSDRWFYFPMVGLLGIIGVSVDSVKHTSINSGTYIKTFVVFLIIIFSFRTFIRNTNWYNGISLYSYNLQYIKNDDVIENALAVELMKVRDYPEAQIHFKNLLARNPTQFALYINLAETYELTGDISDAKSTYEKVLNIDGSGIGYYNLSRIILQKESNPTEAIKIAEKGIQQYPQNANLWIVMAIANYELGNQKDALSEATKAKDLLPSPQADTIYNMVVNHKPLN